MYKPLPSNLTIHNSAIHDSGIFAKENIPEQTDLGMTHVELGKLILRTPLGGFLIIPIHLIALKHLLY